MEQIQSLIYVLVAAVIVCVSAFVCKYLYTKWNQIKTQIKNDNVREILDSVVNTVYCAVAATNQTFVDAMKQSGTFDTDAAKNAFSKTKSTILNMLSKNAIDVIKQVYGDFNIYIDTLIESTVKEQKY